MLLRQGLSKQNWNSLCGPGGLELTEIPSGLFLLSAGFEGVHYPPVFFHEET